MCTLQTKTVSQNPGSEFYLRACFAAYYEHGHPKYFQKSSQIMHPRRLVTASVETSERGPNMWERHAAKSVRDCENRERGGSCQGWSNCQRKTSHTIVEELL